MSSLIDIYLSGTLLCKTRREYLFHVHASYIISHNDIAFITWHLFDKKKKIILNTHNNRSLFHIKLSILFYERNEELIKFTCYKNINNGSKLIILKAG